MRGDFGRGGRIGLGRRLSREGMSFSDEPPWSWDDRSEAMPGQTGLTRGGADGPHLPQNMFPALPMDDTLVPTTGMRGCLLPCSPLKMSITGMKIFVDGAAHGAERYAARARRFK